ncbi:MAG TPA: ASPIC/UnbV domain-containing protein, partial [Gemmatimonadaceae bacterium]|nr:ASPIC/UnbV domain-containing protein [Gemmatimonadaceae bacterium]
QDLFLTHWIAQGNALYDNLPRRSPAGTAAKASQSPPVTFMDESDRYGLGQISLDYIGWATSFIDYDLDGKLDLFVVNGSTLQKRDDPSSLGAMRSKMFWNRGTDEGFFDVSPVSGAYFGKAYVGRGAAFADYDNDGDVDVFVVNHGGPGILLRNDGGNRNHWLQVQLRGTRSNPQGIGAKVRLVAGGVAQRRQVGAQSPYLSQNALVETFGLAQLPKVDTIEVWWPSGARDRRTDVAANQRILIVEGEPGAVGAVKEPVSARGAGDSTIDAHEKIRRFWSVYREATAQRIARQPQLAAESYARALALDPDHEDALYYGGSMRLELGDFQGAARHWRHLLAVNPSSARTHSRLGALHQCLDPRAPFQLDSAEWHLRRAHELNQEENGPLLRLGEVALIRGDLASARRYLAAVLATHSTNSAAHFYTGYLAFRAHDAMRARDELRLAAATPAPSAPVPGASSEGDTKRASAPPPPAAEPCNELRTLAEHPRPASSDQDVARRYRELEGVLASARRRMR